MSIEVIGTLKIKKKYYDIFWTRQFLFTKFPPSSMDDFIDFLAHEKLTNHLKIWHLHSRTMLQNFRKIDSGDFKLLPVVSLNDPTDKNAFGQFGWFSRVGSHIISHHFFHDMKVFGVILGYSMLSSYF